MKHSPHIALLTANALLGANFSFYASLYAEGVGYAEIFLMQIVVSALIFTPFAGLFYRSHKRLTLEDFGSIFTIALVVIFGWLYLLTRGASLTNPIDASTLSTIGPIVTLIIAYTTRAELPSKMHIAGTVVALAGAVTMLIDRQITSEGSSTIYIGDALVAISVIAAAIHTTLARQQLQRYGALTVIALYFAIGTTLALPILWSNFIALLHRNITAAIGAEMLYIALFGTALPFWLLYTATPQVSSSVAASYRYMQPLTAIVMAIIRGQTTPDNTNILGMIVIIFGVILLGVATERSSATL